MTNVDNPPNVPPPKGIPEIAPEPPLETPKPSLEPYLGPDGKWRRPEARGGYLMVGGSGPQPGSGRPPLAFKKFLAELRRDPSAQQALETAARDPKSKNFQAAWRVLVEYDEDKPAKRIELAAPLTDAERAAKVRQILARVAEEQG